MAHQAADRRMVLAGLTATLMWTSYWLLQAWHYWEDDAYIHLAYARSVYEGHGFRFNGTLSNGDTSPLWVLLLAVSHGFTDNWLTGGKALTIITTAMTLGIAWQFISRLVSESRNTHAQHTPADTATSALLLCLFVLSPFFCAWSFSGMEAITTIGWVMLTSLSLVPKKPSGMTFFGAASLMGLGPLLRPELMLMVATGSPFLMRQWHALTQQGLHARKVSWFLLSAALLALPMILWSVYAWQAFGYVLPNTNAAKRAAPEASVMLRLLSLHALGFPALLLSLGALLISCVTSRLRLPTANPRLPQFTWPALLWTTATFIFYVLNHTYVQTRYVVVVAPCAMFVALVMLKHTLRPWVFHAVLGMSAAIGMASSLWMAQPNIRNKVTTQHNTAAFAQRIQAELPLNRPGISRRL